MNESFHNFFITELIEKIFGNTFFGVLFAGILLIYIGFTAYRNQRSYEMECDRQERIRDLSMRLSRLVLSSSTEYLSHLKNYHDASIEVLHKEMHETYVPARFEGFVKNIDKIFDELSMEISLDKRYKPQYEVLSEHIAALKFYLITIGAVPSIEKKRVDEITRKVSDTTDAIHDELMKIASK